MHAPCGNSSKVAGSTVTLKMMFADTVFLESYYGDSVNS